MADTTRAVGILETSHPPVYYIPRDDVRSEFLKPSPRRSFCEFKGSASYWSLDVNGRIAKALLELRASFARVRVDSRLSRVLCFQG